MLPSPKFRDYQCIFFFCIASRLGESTPRRYPSHFPCHTLWPPLPPAAALNSRYLEQPSEQSTLEPSYLPTAASPTLSVDDSQTLSLVACTQFS